MITRSVQRHDDAKYVYFLNFLTALEETKDPQDLTTVLNNEKFFTTNFAYSDYENFTVRFI